MVWSSQKDARGMNSKINYGLDTTGEKGNRTSNKKKTWMEAVQAAMTTRNLEPEQWRNREEWRLVSGKWRQLLKKPDRQIDINLLFPRLCEKSSMHSAIANNAVSSLYLQNVPIR